MKRLAVAIILLVLFTLMFRYIKGGSSSSSGDVELSVDSVFAAAGAVEYEDRQKHIEGYLELHRSQGYMSLYREVYRIALDRQRFDFAHRLTAVSLLLVLSHEADTPGPMHGSGKRLFIHFCRLSVVDMLFALELNKMDRKLGLFHTDSVLSELWQDYLRHVWGRAVLPQLLQNDNISPEQVEFIGLLPEFIEDYQAKKKDLKEEKRTGNPVE